MKYRSCLDSRAASSRLNARRTIILYLSALLHRKRMLHDNGQNDVRENKHGSAVLTFRLNMKRAGSLFLRMGRKNACMEPITYAYDKTNPGIRYVFLHFMPNSGNIYSLHSTQAHVVDLAENQTVTQRLRGSSMKFPTD